MRPDRADQFDAGVVYEWLDLGRALVKGTAGYSPPVAARAFGCTAVALYEGLVPGMHSYRSLTGILPDLPPTPGAGRNIAYHWPTVANRVLAQSLRDLFPTAPSRLHEAVDSLETRFADAFRAATPRAVFTRSVDRGTAVGRAIFAWSKGDGGHEAYLRNFPTDYTPPVGPGLWEPTPPDFLPALQPRWGENRCLTLAQADECAPGPPPLYSTHSDSAFHDEGQEVYQTVNDLNDEQLTIARFWSDDPGATSTPAGHSVSILTQALRARDASLQLAAEAFVRLGLAVSDAFVTCWSAKYRYNVLRPITYIRNVIDSTWGDAAGPHPLPLVTPPFPEYPSGHSVQSGAAATVLSAMFGEQPFTDHTHDQRGFAPRHFASFAAAAQEAAISRLYGGIHFRAAIDRGLAHGHCVGAKASAMPLRV